MNQDTPWLYIAMVVIAFISWVFNRIQEATAARRRANELKRRRAEGQPEPSSPPPLPGRSAPPTKNEQAEDALRELFEALGGPSREVVIEEERPRRPEPTPPPPAQPKSRPPERRREPEPVKKPVLSAQEQAALKRIEAGKGLTPISEVMNKPPGAVRISKRKRSTHGVRRLLATPEGLKNAVILKEILDAPLSLRQEPRTWH